MSGTWWTRPSVAKALCRPLLHHPLTAELSTKACSRPFSASFPTRASSSWSIPISPCARRSSVTHRIISRAPISTKACVPFSHAAHSPAYADRPSPTRSSWSGPSYRRRECRYRRSWRGRCITRSTREWATALSRLCREEAFADCIAGFRRII